MKSKKFHLSTCSSVQDIQQSNRITFATRAAAVKQGYSPCKVCRPLPLSTQEALTAPSPTTRSRSL